MNDNIMSLPNGDFYSKETIENNQSLESHANKFIIYNKQIWYCVKELEVFPFGLVCCVMSYKDYILSVDKNIFIFTRIYKKYCQLITDEEFINMIVWYREDIGCSIKNVKNNITRFLENVSIKRENSNV